MTFSAKKRKKIKSVLYSVSYDEFAAAQTTLSGAVDRSKMAAPRPVGGGGSVYSLYDRSKMAAPRLVGGSAQQRLLSVRLRSSRPAPLSPRRVNTEARLVQRRFRRQQDGGTRSPPQSILLLPPSPASFLLPPAAFTAPTQTQKG